MSGQEAVPRSAGWDMEFYSVDGLSFKEIARAMDLSPAAMRYYLSNIYRRLGVKNKVQLVAIMRTTE